MEVTYGLPMTGMATPRKDEIPIRLYPCDGTCDQSAPADVMYYYHGSWLCDGCMEDETYAYCVNCGEEKPMWEYPYHPCYACGYEGRWYDLAVCLKDVLGEE